MKKMDCSCKHEYQDKTNGEGKRWFNEGLKDYKCTVCGRRVLK